MIFGNQSRRFPGEEIGNLAGQQGGFEKIVRAAGSCPRHPIEQGSGVGGKCGDEEVVFGFGRFDPLAQPIGRESRGRKAQEQQQADRNP